MYLFSGHSEVVDNPLGRPLEARLRAFILGWTTVEAQPMAELRQPL